ncbi:glycosyltransferase family 2 protein [Microbacterium karelineae]|uniref:glycosyltransferase family 2 protein n=1 Tax=Microbacterium karelineae TaxID=2654283 RepID=UPI0012E9AE9F|nr:glycosyltransferase family 2 protein [Microbacterium karelineae]
MTQPRVAIVVRTKDRPRFLDRALRSITAQTETAWECVVVNDGGDPGAVDDMVARVPEQHREKVRVLHRRESHGRWASANAGVLTTTAPYLVLHDDDDSWHPEFLERAVRYLDSERNARRGGVVSRIEIVWERAGDDGDLTEIGREIFQQQLTAPTLGDTLLFNRFVPIGFVYRRELHDELGLYDESLPVVGDWNFALQVLTRGALEYLDDDTPYAYWHQRPGQSGADGNSVISSDRLHRRFDAQIRDEALREYVDEHGSGLALYLTKYIDQRLAEMETRIRDDIARYSLPERALRILKRKLGR